MTKYSFLLLLLFNSLISFSQSNVILKGTVVDINTQLPLELATVYFSNVKDSTVLEYATTDKNGSFRLDVKKYDRPVLLKINFVGYQVFSEEQSGLMENKDFGKLYLLKNNYALDEVVIKSEAPPVRIKKDTLEYNATSFKVRPDANVELLLKQLPGFDIDNDGKITVNGKEVSQFLVNGKAFFDKDGAMALKNLPADIISKIQVSDFKTKKEELAKQESTSDYSSINLTIDEKKNKGYFGKFLAGVGTDGRYESSFIVNVFNKKQKISVLGSSNNINSSGFTMDDVFDGMGGGRNNRSGNKSTVSGKGITQTNLLGLNYSDDWTKKLIASGSYDFSNSINKNDSKSNQTNFLPKGNIYAVSESNARNENTGNKANFELEYKITPTTRLVISPNVNLSRSNSSSTSTSLSTDDANEIINQSNSTSTRENNSSNFGNTINFNKAFTKRARNLSFIFNNRNTGSDSDAINVSTTILKGASTDSRNQNSLGKNEYDSYSAEIEYTEPITDSLRLRVGSDFNWERGSNDLKTYDFDKSLQEFSTFNDLLSNYLSTQQSTISPKVGLVYEKNKYTFSLNSNTSIVNFDNHSFYLNKNTDLNKNYILPYARAQIRYKFDRSKYFTLRYEYINSLPSTNQLMPVENLANPLNTIVGNPFLNLNRKNTFNINYRNFDTRSRSGYSLFLRGDFYDSEVVSTSVYDIVYDSNGLPTTNGKRTTTYDNVSGTYSTSIGGNFYQSIKKEAHTLRYGLSIYANYALDKGFTNSVLYKANSLGLTPRIYISYDYGELLTIAPSYGLSYNESKYDNSSLKSSTNVVHRFNLQTTNYWPKNWVFGNDFGYTYNSKLSSTFKKDFYTWNSSLSYGFFEKKMILKIKVYDILNQNLSATRTISATSIRDEQNTVLKRYAMLSLSYKLGNFGDRKSGNNRGGRDRH